MSLLLIHYSVYFLSDKNIAIHFHPVFFIYNFISQMQVSHFFVRRPSSPKGFQIQYGHEPP